MVARRECEFFLLQYVPDPVRNEFVHVGVVLREMGGPVASVKFTSDWRRVRCLDPEADTGMLEGLESELRRRFQAEPDGNLMHVLEDSFSNSVQMTRGKAYLAESVEAGVEELMRMYVEPLKRERVSRLSGRAAIQAQMRTEFERAGVWDLLRKRIAVAEYTRPGDPLRIDLGYRPNGVIRMFQAVSLETSSGAGLEAAKALAFSAPALRAGALDHEPAQQRSRHRLGVDLVFTCADPPLEFVEPHVAYNLSKSLPRHGEFSAASAVPPSPGGPTGRVSGTGNWTDFGCGGAYGGALTGPS